MAEAKLLLKRPINELYFDLDENSLEVVGYEKVVYCENCTYRMEHYNSDEGIILLCKYWDDSFVDFMDYCSHGIKEVKNEMD